ncbi:hypothetical protein EJV47_11035 [Hymenobacter gummosus]|uniref:Uncharacterized protein n=1 Tax=Hymenobacter gummosus TaxID=1776032 RepID=A0A3S0JHM0_9BACT|nr:hypothetical protein [Hymenobacter gummosus]RTQ50162.1 hypothetical protein EJV47_11035 [Hymenobacter gummosus]
MTPPADDATAPRIRQILLTVFGCYATRDEYTPAHLLTVVQRLLGEPACTPELLDAELRSCPFARSRGQGPSLRWRFVNAHSVCPPRPPADGPARPRSAIAE